MGFDGNIIGESNVASWKIPELNGGLVRWENHRTK